MNAHRERPSVSPQQIRLGAVIAVAVAVGILAWILLRDGSEKSSRGFGPRVVSPEELRRIATSSIPPVYWAGVRKGRKLEFTKTESGREFVRYLPKAVQAGDVRPAFLTVGTYPEQNAYEAVRVASRGKGATRNRIGGGGLLVGRKGGSKSVHFSYPGSGYQVEVFDPIRGRGRRLVLTGQVQRVR